MAHLVDIPNVVYDAIKAKMYKNVSIEALYDVKHKGVEYGTVLTAVSLLGADIPAVNTLNDLRTYMTNKNLDFGSHATFSLTNPKDERRGIMPMTPEEQSEFDRMKATIKAQTDAINEAAKEKAKLSSENAALKNEVSTVKEEGEVAKFTAEKTAVKIELETLVKAGTITPAKRDELLSGFTKENASSIKFTIETLKSLTPTVKFAAGAEQGSVDNEGNSSESAEDFLHNKAMKLSVTDGVKYEDAIVMVMNEHPDKAEEWRDSNGEV